MKPGTVVTVESGARLMARTLFVVKSLVLSGLVIWLANLQLRTMRNEDRLQVLLATSTGTPKQEVVSRLHSGIKPRDLPGNVAQDWFPSLKVPEGGSVLHYDSFQAFKWYGADIQGFVVIFDRTDHVVGVYFQDYSR